MKKRNIKWDYISNGGGARWRAHYRNQTVGLVTLKHDENGHYYTAGWYESRGQGPWNDLGPQYKELADAKYDVQFQALQGFEN